MVPVTTKPYLNSVPFIILRQGVPAFFIDQRKNQSVSFFQQDGICDYKFRRFCFSLSRYHSNDASNFCVCFKQV